MTDLPERLMDYDQCHDGDIDEAAALINRLREPRQLEVSITILGDDEGVEFRIEDELSSVTFVEFKMTPEDFCHAALGRLSGVKCKAEIKRLDRMGLKMEVGRHTFPVPDRDKEFAKEESKRTCPEGWTPDGYFNAQDSFFNKGGQTFAKDIIRRWV